ncbi:hypothetical protein B0A55_00101 [Friedmanniomyces simplex]|uniref:Uncharacterized protein n=1 Tax=Friedmanniomyces simplex TaxID=329884 RepID=A0A4U0Y0G9_9PEZI|nr:hypothetical protein B0A55_00101 [Friedmanniomyces simplex]
MHRLPRAFRLRQLQQPPILHHRPSSTRPRNFSLIPRRKGERLSTTLYRPTAEPVRYQAVRFRRPPFFTQRQAIVVLAYTGVAYAYFSLLLRFFEVEIEILDDDEEDEAHEHEGEREGREVTGEVEEGEGSGIFYADEGNAFIPLTWATSLPRTFYRRSDPEWQEFIKVAKDKPRHKKLQNELVRLVFSSSIKHPAIHSVLGNNPKVGKYWLDMAFPDRPPPEYVRSGLEIGDGFVAWSQQKVTQENQWRITRALWPKAAAQGFWAMGSALAGMQYRRVKQALGWEGRDPGSPEEKYRILVETMEKRQRARRQKIASRGAQQVGEGDATPPQQQQTPDGTSTAGAVVTSSGTAPASTQQQQQQKQGQHPPTPNKPPPASSTFPSLPLPSTTIPTAVPVALHIFNATLSKSWVPPKPLEPPRGAFTITGLVEVRGEKGRVLLDVQGVYDPRTGKFVRAQAGVRALRGWRQDANGGP